MTQTTIKGNTLVFIEIPGSTDYYTDFSVVGSERNGYSFRAKELHTLTRLDFALPCKAKFLFTSKDATKEDCAAVVENDTVNGWYKYYHSDNEDPEYRAVATTEAKNSFHSLLISLKLYPQRNYAVLKRVK